MRPVPARRLPHRAGPARACASEDVLLFISCLCSGDWTWERSSEQVVSSLSFQDKEDGEPKTKQFRDGEEDGEKHR